jgi:hypothetical protein
MLLLQGANNPLDTASYASKRKDDKYVIPLLDVVHIDVGASNEDQPIPSGSNRGRAIPSSQLSESRKLSTKIFLRGGAGSTKHTFERFFLNLNILFVAYVACILETFHSNHIGKAIISSWHSALVRKSADVRKLDAPVNIALASAYYRSALLAIYYKNSRLETGVISLQRDSEKYA